MIYLFQMAKRFYRYNRRSPKNSLSSFPVFLRQFRVFQQQAAYHNRSGEFPCGRFYPILTESKIESGTAKGHYFHQDLVVARSILKDKPVRHIDVGSRVDGFVAHVAVFREIEVIDIRDLDVHVQNITFLQADLMKKLPENLISSCDSLSCLHAIEHFGLGRYGDPIDFIGHEKAIANLEAMLKPGGRLYLSVPIGPQRLEFNAHRVFAVETILDLLGERFDINRFSYVDDKGSLHEDTHLTNNGIQDNYGWRIQAASAIGGGAAKMSFGVA
jgi:hypothetical protein